MCPLFTDVHRIDESDQEVDDEHPVVNAWWTVIPYAARTVNDQCNVQQAICNIRGLAIFERTLINRIVSYVSATNPTIELYKQLLVGYISQRKLKQDAVVGGRLRPLLPPPGDNGGEVWGAAILARIW